MFSLYPADYYTLTEILEQRGSPPESLLVPSAGSEMSRVYDKAALLFVPVHGPVQIALPSSRVPNAGNSMPASS
jgi:hypothetical protein